MNKRVEWIDAAKFIGIFLIYLGHFGADAGFACEWVYTFHVPFFFFLSGCVENYNKRGFFQNLYHKFVTVIIPFAFFIILEMIMQAVQYNSYFNIANCLLAIVRGGSRDTLPVAGPVWFLSCLFVIEVIFSLIKKLKRKPLIAASCAGLLVIYELFLQDKTNWYWNINRACYYLIFYYAGWALFGAVDKLLTSEDTRIRWVRAVLFVISAVYSALLFFGKNALIGIAGINSIFNVICELVTAMLGIMFAVFVSYVISSNDLVKKIGKNTIYLCGNEFIAKTIIPEAAYLIGLNVAVASPLEAVIYAVLALLFSNFVLTPIERPFLGKIQEIMNRLPDYMMNKIKNKKCQQEE